jgi:hypothetical protein
MTNDKASMRESLFSIMSFPETIPGTYSVAGKFYSSYPVSLPPITDYKIPP